ncbi:hypothetical protein SD71_15360 [Cohnella kolymensis]|uniref:Uncharacterized protein n=1 Tax=Cohnella kolymensis TaxID=1590652 RepID=A0ABR5A1X1_9BACL|nr:hypothetical protein SD71_15360 [Cohnella kolymensis]
MPKLLSDFVSFIVGVVFMLLPELHDVLIVNILGIDSFLKSILNTAGLIILVIFGFKIIKKTLKD